MMDSLPNATLYSEIKRLSEDHRYQEVHQILSTRPRKELLKDPQLCMYAVGALGRLYRHSEAMELLRAVEDSVLQSSDGNAIRRWQQAYAVLLGQNGRLREARNLLITCLESALADNDLRSIAHACNSLGVHESISGELQSAIHYYNRAIGAWRRIGKAHGVGLGHFNLSVVLREWGSLKEATSNLMLAEEYIECYGSKADRVFISLERPMLLLRLGDTDLAENAAKRTLNQALREQRQGIVARAEKVLGHVLLCAGQVSEAEKMLTGAYDKISSEPNILLQAEIKGDLALLAALRGSNRDIFECFNWARQFYISLNAQKRLERLSERLNAAGWSFEHGNGAELLAV